VCVTLEEGSGIGDQGSTTEASESHEVERMVTIVTRLAAAVDVPLFIDSANPEVLRTALPCIGRRGVVNSLTLARGIRDLETMAPVVREQNARLVVLCIDEDGMAVSSDRKLDLARRLYRLTRDLELDTPSLIVDPLTFPVASKRAERQGAARETLSAIRQIKDLLPDVQTLLGISDISFGLPAAARPALNAVFLHHCVEAGLDVAIVNIATHRAYEDLSEEERTAAEDLLFDRRPDALARLVAGIPAH
jgi:5-methyltetrahydrofolate--homocysteine methyltransferase